MVCHDAVIVVSRVFLACALNDAGIYFEKVGFSC